MNLLVALLLFAPVFAMVLKFSEKERLKEERPGSYQEPKLLNFLKEKTKTLTPISSGLKDLGKDEGTFHTEAEFPNAWERVVDSLTRFPISSQAKFRWRNIQPDQAYRRIVMNANWSDNAQKNEYQVDVFCVLTFVPLDGGGTSIRYKYNLDNHCLMNLDLAAEKLKRDTNKRIEMICTELTANPCAGLPF